MVAAGDVRRRHHLRLKVRGTAARVRVLRSWAGLWGQKRILGWEDQAALELRDRAQAGAREGRRGSGREGLY